MEEEFKEDLKVSIDQDSLKSESTTKHTSGDKSDPPLPQHMTPPHDLTSKSDDDSDPPSAQVTASSGNSTNHWPPPGWDVEERTKIYKVHIERKTGKKFYSQKKAEAYYLQNSTPHQTLNKRRKLSMVTGREETNVVGLPHPWFRVIRCTEGRAGIRNEDVLYVHPVNDYAFFSMADAQRYIDSGDIKDCCVKPRRWNEIYEDINKADDPGNNFHSRPTDEETQLKSTEETEKEINEGDNSDEDNEPKSEERIESNCEEKSEDPIDTDDVPIEKAGREEKGKELIFKIPASRASKPEE